MSEEKQVGPGWSIGPGWLGPVSDGGGGAEVYYYYKRRKIKSGVRK